MRANPSQCRHEHTCVEAIFGIEVFIRCLDCDDTWSLDEWPILNPDNDPTSEHAMWRQDNDGNEIV